MDWSKPQIHKDDDGGVTSNLSMINESVPKKKNEPEETPQHIKRIQLEREHKRQWEEKLAAARALERLRNAENFNPDTFMKDRDNAWDKDVERMKQERQEARECMFCRMRIEDLKRARFMHDQFERDVRVEHAAMLRELRACKRIVAMNQLDDQVRKFLVDKWPAFYKPPEKGKKPLVEYMPDDPIHILPHYDDIPPASPALTMEDTEMGI